MPSLLRALASRRIIVPALLAPTRNKCKPVNPKRSVKNKESNRWNLKEPKHMFDVRTRLMGMRKRKMATTARLKKQFVEMGLREFVNIGGGRVGETTEESQTTTTTIGRRSLSRTFNATRHQ